MANREARMTICASVLSETARILARTPTGSSRSIYYRTLLPPLAQPASPKSTQTNIEVVDGDTYSVAQSLLLQGKQARQGKVAVLNLASEQRPGGGWKGGSLAQEECLCYRSTLFVTLDGKGYYPIPSLGGIYSPAVVVFRKEMKDDFKYLPWDEHFVVGVVTIAGLRNPKLDDHGSFEDPGDYIQLANKIRQTLRILAVNGQKYIVLGALGCGAFNNPPKLVAELFRDILTEPEFRGWFEEIKFAVLTGNNSATLTEHATATVHPDRIATEQSEQGQHNGSNRDNTSIEASRPGGQTTITQFFDVQNSGRQRQQYNDRGHHHQREERNRSNSSRSVREGQGRPENQRRIDNRRRTGQQNFDIFSEVLDGLMVP